MMFLTGTVVEDGTATDREPTKDEQKKEKERSTRRRRRRRPRRRPKFSAGQARRSGAQAEGNADFFAKTIVNRMWHRFFGCGLVNPLDQMHSENPPATPNCWRGWPATWPRTATTSTA